MPKVRFAPSVEEIQGTLYDVVFKKSPKGNPIVTKRPDVSNVKWSQAQKSNRERMGEANKYAKAVMADPAVRAVYEEQAGKEHRIPLRMAISDYSKGKNLLPK